MTSSRDHTAAASATGYLYQCERAMLELATLAAGREATLFMEVLDDIHFESDGRPLDILQLKHHSARRAGLGDSSPDLWRSIGVWMDLIGNAQIDGDPVLRLLTTAKAASGSAASFLLTGSQRDAVQAQGLLERAATESTDQATEGMRARFLELNDGERKRLVDSIAIHDKEPRLTDLDDHLASAMRLDLYFRATQRGAFLDRLKGWWYGQCVRMLTDQSQLSTADFRAFTQDLREQFHPEDLPDDFGLDDPDDADLSEYESSIFVEQLRWIAYTNEQLADAIRDYYRAYTHRSRWAREGLLYPGELEQYEARLVDQWQRVFHDIVAELSEEASEQEKEAAGRGLLQGLRDSDIVRLRKRYSEVFLTHGTLHQLADRRRVGWHPEFEQRLESLLGGAA